MRNNKGVNLIALTVTIIVMIILASIAINTGTNSHEKALEARAKEERAQVTAAVQNRFGDNQINSTANPLVGEKIPTGYKNVDEIFNYIVTFLKEKGRLLTEDEINNQTNQKEIKGMLDLAKNGGGFDYIRILSHSDAIALGIDNLPLETYFVVDYYSTTVIGPIY